MEIIKMISGIFMIVAETFLIFYVSHIGYQIISRQRKKLGLLTAYSIGVVYVGGMILGFRLIGASITVAIAMLYLIFLVAMITTLIYEMAQTPFILVSKPESTSKKSIFLNILTQIIIISILFGLIVIIVIAGYRYYFKGILPGL